MHLIIEIKEGKTNVLLARKTGERLDALALPEGENITDKLWPLADELLQRNSLSLEQVEKMVVESDLEETYTSRRVAEAAARAFFWTKQEWGKNPKKGVFLGQNENI